MQKGVRHFFFLLIKLIILALFFLPFLEKANALDELFHTYDSPSALAMGNALVADASGYTALYYNPAGLAKAPNNRWTITPLELDTFLSVGGIGNEVGAGSFGIYNLASQLTKTPGNYDYFRLNALSYAARRGLGIAVLGDYYYAARGNGNQLDINAGEDLGPTVGAAMNFFGNSLKIGVALKAIDRNSIDGTYPLSDFSSADTVKANMQEGLGIGADIGTIIALPVKFLPAMGIVWHDVGNTKFIPTHILNGSANGAPAPILQSYDAGFSIHPSLGHGWGSTIAVSVEHLELSGVLFRKRSHFGIEVQNSKSLFFWAGLNQMFWTAGFGYRIKGGSLEIGSYAEDIGDGNTIQEDRRMFMRYTIEF